MYTTQSKMISRAIWVEKKHVWKINLQKNGVRKSFYSSVPVTKAERSAPKMQPRGCLELAHLASANVQRLIPCLSATSKIRHSKPQTSTPSATGITTTLNL